MSHQCSVRCYEILISDYTAFSSYHEFPENLKYGKEVPERNRVNHESTECYRFCFFSFKLSGLKVTESWAL